MKKGLNFFSLFILSFALLSSSALAETGLTKTKAVGDRLINSISIKKEQKKVIGNEQITDGDKAGPENDSWTESESPMNSETGPKSYQELKAIAAQFQIIITRTQSTIDKLAKRSVDISSSQAALDSAKSSLVKFQNDLKVILTSTDKKTAEKKTSDDKSDQTPTTKNLEEELKKTRQSLLESLSNLKGAIALHLSMLD